MVSSPIASWQIEGETMEPVTGFIFLGSKITADGDCSHEIKTLVPWKKSYDQTREHIKSRDINLSTNVCLVKGMIFPAEQFESINSSAVSLLHDPTLTSIHDYWKNHSFDYMDLCRRSDVSAF